MQVLDKKAQKQHAQILGVQTLVRLTAKMLTCPNIFFFFFCPHLKSK